MTVSTDLPTEYSRTSLLEARARELRANDPNYDRFAMHISDRIHHTQYWQQAQKALQGKRIQIGTIHIDDTNDVHTDQYEVACWHETYQLEHGDHPVYVEFIRDGFVTAVSYEVEGAITSNNHQSLFGGNPVSGNGVNDRVGETKTHTLWIGQYDSSPKTVLRAVATGKLTIDAQANVVLTDDGLMVQEGVCFGDSLVLERVLKIESRPDKYRKDEHGNPKQNLAIVWYAGDDEVRSHTTYGSDMRYAQLLMQEYIKTWTHGFQLTSEGA